MPTITFLPHGGVHEYTAGESIFDVAQRANVAVDTACVGKATCGLCRVTIVEGEPFLNDITDAEIKHLGNVYFLTKMRLSCQCKPEGGDLVVKIAPKKARKRRTP